MMEATDLVWLSITKNNISAVYTRVSHANSTCFQAPAGAFSWNPLVNSDRIFSSY